MHKTIIVRYAEIALKGKNRADFEKKLVTNIAQCLKNCRIKYEKIYRKPGRILIKGCSKADQLSNVFGIANFSHATETEPEIESIISIADNIISKKKFKSFRVSANRSDKSPRITSQQINIKLGEHIATKHRKKVDLTKYNLDVGVEIIDRKAYIFAGKLKGPGGLPLGSTGRVLVLLDSIKSLRAAELMMKRGCRVVFAQQKDKTGKEIGNRLKIDWKHIEKYNNYEKFRVLEYKKMDDPDEIRQLMKKSKAKALVVSYGLEDFDKLQDLKNMFPDILILSSLL